MQIQSSFDLICYNHEGRIGICVSGFVLTIPQHTD